MEEGHIVGGWAWGGVAIAAEGGNFPFRSSRRHVNDSSVTCAAA